MPGNLQRTLKNTKQRLKKKPPDILSIFNSSDWLQTIYCNINWLLFGVFPLKFLQTCLNRFLSFFKFEMSRYLWLLLVLGPHLALSSGIRNLGDYNVVLGIEAVLAMYQAASYLLYYCASPRFF